MLQCCLRRGTGLRNGLQSIHNRTYAYCERQSEIIADPSQITLSQDCQLLLVRPQLPAARHQPDPVAAHPLSPALQPLFNRQLLEQVHERQLEHILLLSRIFPAELLVAVHFCCYKGKLHRFIRKRLEMLQLLFQRTSLLPFH
ncbi:hypothetical protein D3C75_453710 [compost metagenome]